MEAGSIHSIMEPLIIISGIPVFEIHINEKSYGQRTGK
jgi:hypothetical protein